AGRRPFGGRNRHAVCAHLDARVGREEKAQRSAISHQTGVSMIAQEVLKPTASPSAGASPKPSIPIRKAAVLGAGTMGSRIAAHLANAGLPVVLLDISTPGAARSGIAAQS